MNLVFKENIRKYFADVTSNLELIADQYAEYQKNVSNATGNDEYTQTAKERMILGYAKDFSEYVKRKSETVDRLLDSVVETLKSCEVASLDDDMIFRAATLKKLPGVLEQDLLNRYRGNNAALEALSELLTDNGQAKKFSDSIYNFENHAEELKQCVASIPDAPENVILARGKINEFCKAAGVDYEAEYKPSAGFSMIQDLQARAAMGLL